MLLRRTAAVGLLIRKKFLSSFAEILITSTSNSTTTNTNTKLCCKLSTISHHIKRSISTDKKLPPHDLLKMPALSPTMSQGNIGQWSKAEGDKVEPGDVLVEIETDKATMDMECQQDGYLAKILIPSGVKDVPVGRPLLVIVSKKEDLPLFSSYEAPAPSDTKVVPAAASVPAVKEEKSQTPFEQTKTQPQSPQSSTAREGQRVLASPIARILAAERGIPLSSLKGSGPGGRVQKIDVESYANAGGGIAAAQRITKIDETYLTPNATVIPLSAMRSIIAGRLLESKTTIPHYYLTSKISIQNIAEMRQKLKGEVGKRALDTTIPSYNDFIIKACSSALIDVPECNASFLGDHIKQWSTVVDMSVAVATPNGGLITPIIRASNTLRVDEISKQMRLLASKAREGKLAPQEYQGGTFTISNLGSLYGGVVQSFSAIINPPQACIMAVGAVEDGMIYITLSCDHRVIDGAVGAKFLQRFKLYMEDPLRMIL